MRKKICIITGTRADYGIISGLVKKISESQKIKLILIVSCMHLQKKFGNTIKEIKNDKLKIAYKVKNFPKGDDEIDIISAFSKGTIEFGKIFKKEKPNLVLLTGDRFEMLSAGISSTYLKIPNIHIHGGEVTHGSLDDYNRHMITKLSQYHFAATKRSKKRIIQLGENPNTVFHSGGLGAYNLVNEKVFNKKEIKNKFKINFLAHNILITLHPELLTTKNQLLKNIKILLNSLKYFKDSLKIFTSSNSDAGGESINNEVKKFVKNNINSIFIKNFGKKGYLSVMKHSSCILGNSSSGILEAPIYKVPTINVGNRQSGRELSKSIINVSYDKKKIIKAINLSKSQAFKNNLKNSKSVYYKKNTLRNIFAFLDKNNFQFNLKKFHDL